MTGNILLSYWYTRKTDLDRVLEPHPGAAIFADSGAYSAMTTGAEIDIHDYAQWLIRWKHRFTVYSNLDVIGDPNATVRNQTILEDQYGLTPLPVFHTGEPWEWLEGYATRYDYIALGGMARKEYQANVLMPWIVRCFRTVDGAAGLHGFGATDWRVMSSFPWRSVDSTTWQAGNRFGAQLIFARNRLFQTRSHLMRQYDQDLQRLGYSAAEAQSACRKGTKGGDNELANEIAQAAMTKAQEHLRRKFNTDLRIYLAGLL